MNNILVRWALRLIASATIYPVMQFVVLPIIATQRPQPTEQLSSAWENVNKQIGASKTIGASLSSSESQTTHLPAQGSQGDASAFSAKVTEAGGRRIVISPALNLGKSVRFEASKATSGSSRNCKPGGK